MLHAACLNLNANQRVSDTSAKVSLEREKGEKGEVEDQLRSKVKEMLQMQDEFEAEKAKLKSRINELSVGLDRTRNQLNDRDQTITDLKSPRKPLVSK